MTIHTTYTTQSASAIKKQAGLSLVELLVSVLIGLFLMAGVITNFVGTKDSEKVRSAMSELDANARVAIDVLRQTVAHAGYRSIDSYPGNQAFYSDKDPVASDLACMDGTNTVLNGYTPLRTKDGTKSDQMTVVFLADNPCLSGISGPAECVKGGLNETKVNATTKKLVYYDCLGGGSDKKARSVSCSSDPIKGLKREGKIYNSFFISDHTLKCGGTRTGGTAQPLVDNVENMQIKYGVTEGIGATTTTQYLTATEVSTADLWGMVTRAQIALLMRSSATNIFKNDTKKIGKTNTYRGDFSYKLLGSSFSVSDKEGRMYRTYTTTINFANQNKAPIFK